MLRNDLTRWGNVARFFHWGIALLILVLLVIGYTMEDVAPADKRMVYGLHKSFGLLVLALVVCRLVWRLGNVVPAMLPTMPRWQVVVAEVVHWGLYAVLFALPVTGYLATSFGNHPFDLFLINGLRVPLFGVPDEALGEVLGEVHGALAGLMIGLLVLHVGAALYHHFVAKDAILARMTPFVRVPQNDCARE